jgi:2-polyprenyl-3-methyl-5-hydroxy-6-metoxy-1,4-benzoquinol methylase
MLSQEIKQFYIENLDKILRNDIVKRMLLATPLGRRQDQDDEGFKKTFIGYLNEAAITVSLIENSQISTSDKLLEVGGGVGLTYIFLTHKGYDIISIEPSDSGFDDYYSIGKVMCEIFDISTDNWYPYLVEDSLKLGKTFDCIFSNNVLEHIPNIEPSFKAMKQVLDQDGFMIHNTVNYIIPYEPHFGMLLVPGNPRFTEVLKPSLKESSMWKGLNFITTRKIAKICKKNSLQVGFDNQVMYQTVQRVTSEENFAQRHSFLVPVLKLVSFLKLTELFKYLPATLNTPMLFTVKHKK